MTTSTITVGDRVRVIEYNKSLKNKYVGLEGLVVDVSLRHDNAVILVLLDDDPAPSLGAMLGGLPCHLNELEKI